MDKLLEDAGRVPVNPISDESSPLQCEPDAMHDAIGDAMNKLHGQECRPEKKSATHLVSSIEAQKVAQFEPGIPGHPGMKMQVLLDTAWTDMGEAEVKQICNNLRFGSQQFGLHSRGGLYTVDFSDLNSITQTNAATKKVRKIRLVPESAPAVDKVIESEPRGPEDGAPASKGVTDGAVGQEGKTGTTTAVAGQGRDTRKNDSCCAVS